MLIRIKNTTNFVLTTFLLDHFLYLAALLIEVNFTKRVANITLSNASSAQDNLSKMITALSA